MQGGSATLVKVKARSSGRIVGKQPVQRTPAVAGNLIGFASPQDSRRRWRRCPGSHLGDLGKISQQNTNRAGPVEDRPSFEGIYAVRSRLVPIQNADDNG